MSLINQMLKDLEQRRRDCPVIDVEDGEADGVRVPLGVHRGVAAGAVLKSLILLVSVVFVGLVFYWGSLPGSAPSGDSVEHAQAGMTDGESSIQRFPDRQGAAVVDEADGKGGEGTELLDMAFARRDGGFRFILEFSASPDFSVKQTSGRSLQLLLPRLQVSGVVAPLQDALPLLDGLQVHEDGDVTKVVLSTVDPAQFRHFLLPENRNYGSRLILDVDPQDDTIRQAGTKAEESRSAKRGRVAGEVEPVPATHSFSPPKAVSGEGNEVLVKSHGSDRSSTDVDSLYRSALDVLGTGDRHSARQFLTEIVRRDPDHHAARKTLAVLLYRMGLVSEAESLFVEGLAMAPRHAPFRKGVARLLVERGETHEAVKVLAVDSAPLLEDDPEYFSLLAACYQRQGEHLAAADVYRKLVESKPGAGLWWMGLGIALEDAGQNNRAHTAYRRAMAEKGLNENLRQFVVERLQHIESGQEIARHLSAGRF